MAKKRQEISPDEAKVLDAFTLDGAELNLGSVTSSAADLGVVEEVVDPRYGPPMWSDKFSEFLTSNMKPEFCDKEGNPTVHMLRLLTRRILGPIIYSGPPDPPQPVRILGTEEENRKFLMTHPVTVRYVVKILWQRPEDGEERVVEFADVADVTTGNTDGEFLRFPSATASTRAEARCLRKALQLNRVSAEELTKVPVEEMDTEIKLSDIIFLDSLCSRLDINLKKFVCCGKQKYEKIGDITHLKCSEMQRYLSSLQNDMTKIPVGIKGYEPNWRETF